MSQDTAVNFNSQAVSPDTLVSIVDDPGKYDVQLGEEGQYVEPKDIPKQEIVKEPALEPRKRTSLVSRFYTILRAWGATQVAWEDSERLTIVISTGAVGGVHFSDNINSLNDAGIASGVGIGHVFADHVVTLLGYTGPLYLAPDTDGADAVTVSVTAVTVQK